MIAYFLTAIVWSVAVELIFILSQRLAQTPDWPDRYRWLYQCAISLSPVAGPMKPVDMLTGVESTAIRVWMGIAAVIVIKATIAWLLLWLTIKTLTAVWAECPSREAPVRSPSLAASNEPALAVMS